MGSHCVVNTDLSFLFTFQEDVKDDPNYSWPLGVEGEEQGKIFTGAYLGVNAAIGAGYKIKRFTFGVEGQWNGLWIQNGWRRDSGNWLLVNGSFATDWNDTVEKTVFRSVPTIGPKISVDFYGHRMALEGTAQFGNEGVGAGLTWRVRF